MKKITLELVEQKVAEYLKNKETFQANDLIINDSLSTATLIRYDDTNKTTKKLIYSFKKAAI